MSRGPTAARAVEHAVLVEPDRRAVRQRQRRAARAVGLQRVARADALARSASATQSDAPLRRTSTRPSIAADLGRPLLAAARGMGVAERPQSGKSEDARAAGRAARDGPPARRAIACAADVCGGVPAIDDLIVCASATREPTETAG